MTGVVSLAGCVCVLGTAHKPKPLNGPKPLNPSISQPLNPKPFPDGCKGEGAQVSTLGSKYSSYYAFRVCRVRGIKLI